MTQRKETIWNLFIIACAIILLGFLGGFVSGILNLGETAGIIIRTAGLLLLISLGMKLFSHFYTKPLTQEMKEEEIKEAEQEDEKQVVFTPSVGVSVIFLFFLFLSVLAIFFQFRDHNVNFEGIGLTIGFMVLWIWLWNTVTVIIFTEDLVHIKTYLVYLFGIDRKTIIQYADITSVSPDSRIKGDFFGVDRRYRIVISTNGATQSFSLVGFNSDTIAKLYLRFKEKLGDKVKLE
jgi:MFS family permease